MKATALIQLLQEHVRKHGDTEIVVHDPQFIFSPQMELSFQGDETTPDAPWSLEYKVTKDHDSSPF